MNKIYNPPDVLPTTAQISHAVEVPAGSRLLYITGQVVWDIERAGRTGFEEQAQECWENIVRILQAADMTLADLVKIQGFIVRPEDRDLYRAVRARVLGDARPASTLLVVARLGRPEWLVEIEAVAAKAAAGGQ